ncbi:hypothetical protein [Ligilactobacillus saerimneri]|uniref:hypothetical protein n=1 Tax=Ligilactobacillus saerimneri TaxID=228229 RepID=UPI0030D3A353
MEKFFYKMLELCDPNSILGRIVTLILIGLLLWLLDQVWNPNVALAIAILSTTMIASIRHDKLKKQKTKE